MMAAIFDNQSSSYNNNSANPLSFATHSINPIATLAVMADSNANSQTDSSCTLDGSSPTTLWSNIVQVGTRASMYYKLQPPGGSKTLAFTHSATSYVAGGIATYLGVLQKAPTASAKAQGSSGAPTVNITTIPGQLVTAFFYNSVADVTFTKHASLTQRFDQETVGMGHMAQLICCDVIATSTTTTVSGTYSAGVDWQVMAAAWDPLEGGEPVSVTPYMMV